MIPALVKDGLPLSGSYSAPTIWWSVLVDTVRGHRKDLAAWETLGVS